MNIPSNAHEVGKHFPEVSAERQQALVTHIEALPVGDNKTIDQMIANGGSEGEFVATLFGRATPGKKDAPKNKKANVPGSK